MLQIDAPVGPMSAGAPLVDAEGKLLGIIVAKSGRDPNSATLAFAVPAAYVEQLLAARQGENSVVIHRGFAGIQLAETKSDEFVKVVIGRVFPDSPAQSTGLRERDEIITIDGRPVTSAQDVLRQIGRHKTGDKIIIQITRDSKPLSKEVILSRPQPPAETSAVPTRSLPPPATVQAVTPSKLYIMLKDGKFVEANPPSSSAAQSEYKVFIERVLKDVQTPAAAGSGAAPTTEIYPPTLYVQRTQVEKKLEDLNAEVRALRKQVELLTAELKKLHEQRK